MPYTVEEAKKLVVEAGIKLVEAGLIARTWGNVSARISDTQFVITPSGKPYKSLTPEQIVVVNIDDLSYEGEIKPSGEKGIHAEAYKLRPDVNFVIHTHQTKASVVSVTGITICDIPKSFADVIGNDIPCADYGMPSTGKLRQGVEKAIKEYPQSKAFMMKHHGAVCLGSNYNEAFNVAAALEQVCSNFIKNTYLKKSGQKEFNLNQMLDYSIFLEDSKLRMPDNIKDFGCSVRNGNDFFLTMKDGLTYTIDVESCVSKSGFVPKAARIHSAIYNTSEVTHINHITNPYVVSISVLDKKVKPFLDDFAQIAGQIIDIGEWNDYNRDETAYSLAKKLKGKNAVFVKDSGAIITGKNLSDIHAVDLVISKECEAEAFVKLFGKGEPLSLFDCLLMREIYIMKYSKQAEK